MCISDVFDLLTSTLDDVCVVMHAKKKECVAWVVLERTWFTEKSKAGNVVEVEIAFC